MPCGLRGAGTCVCRGRRLRGAGEASRPRRFKPVRDQAELLAAFCAAHGLSMRERDVLPLLVDGRTNAEIAAALFVTERTVKYHVHNIMEKTGCTSRQEVVDRYVASTGC